MKYLYITLLALLFSTSVVAQSTTLGINYQAVLRNNAYQAIANQNGTATVSILSSDQTEIYREIHTITTDPLGLFNIIVGNGTALSGTFSTLNWGAGDRSIQVTVAIGGNTYNFPSTALQAVPYAKVAERAIQGDGDNNPTNEIQFLSLSGNQINLSNGGGSVVLPPGTAYTAGPGIGIAGNVITNTGDINANDDLTNNTVFGGDLTGTASNLQIASGAVGSAEIADGSITTADLQPGAISPTNIAPNGATSGQVLQWNGTQWAPANPATSTDNQQLTVAGTQLSISNGNTVQLPAEIDGSVTNELQVLSLSGNQINLSNGGGSVVLPPGTVYTAGPGIGIAGNVITNTGDINANDDLTNNTVFGGDLTGTASNLQIASGAVGSAEIADGSITTADLQPGAISPISIAPNGATSGQVLQWNGTQWAPANPETNTDNQQLMIAGTQLSISNGNAVQLPAEIDGSVTNELQILSLSGNQLSLSNGGGNVQLPNPPVYVAGQGISVNASNVITNTGDTNPLDDVTNATAAGGDLNGFYPAPQINNNSINSSKIADGSIVLADLAPGIIPQSVDDLNDVTTAGVAIGQVLKWNGSQWVPQDDSTTSGSGTTTTSAPLIGNGSAVNPVSIGQNGASNGQVLKWNGGSWSPGNDNGTSYTAGAGITINGAAIAAVDNSVSNELQTLQLDGNQLSISNGNTILLPNDFDTLSTNEIQNLSLSGNQLTLSLGGGSVTLPTTPVYTAGTGISISGNVITNTGDTNAANDLLNTTVADGDITGIFSNLTIKPSRVGTTQLSNNSVTAEKLTPLGATTSGQVLKWNGSAWGAGTDLQGSGGLTLPYSGTCNAVGPQGVGFRIANTRDQTGMYVLNTFGPSTFCDGGTAAIMGEHAGNIGFAQCSGEFNYPPAIGVYGRAVQGDQDGTGVFGEGISYGVRGSSPLSIGGYFTGPRALITSGGAVGLNTFGPNRTVHIRQSNIGIGDSGLKIENVAGNFSAEMAVFNSRLEYYFNDGAAVSFILPNGQYMSTSDRRLKKDIQPFQSSVLDRVNTLGVYTYRYKQEKEDAPLSFGVMAQELQERFPELVSEGKKRTDGESYLGVAYDKLGLIAIKAIQEQQHIIDQQQAELQQVKNDLLQMQQQLLLLSKTVTDLQARQK